MGVVEPEVSPLVGGILEEEVTAPDRVWYLRSRVLRSMCVLVDVITIAAGLGSAFLFSRHVHIFNSRSPLPTCMTVGSISLPVWLFVFSRYRLYTVRFISSRLDELNRLSHAVLASVLCMAAVSFLFRLPVSRSWIITSFFFVLSYAWIGRQLVRLRFLKLRKRGIIRKRVLLVGTNSEAETIWTQLTADPALGYEVIGLLGEPNQVPAFPAPVVGTIADAIETARRTGARGVLVASSAVPSNTTNRLARELTEVGLHVELSSSLWDIGYERLTVQPVGYHPMLYVEPVSRTGWRPAAKRAFDVAVAAGGLLVLSPLMAVVALAVKVTSSGPVLFSQVRVGRNEKPFRVLKFRSMVSDAESLLGSLRDANEADGPLFKMHDDPRVTRVGRVIRKYSLDELPQLFNVLAGHMSIVGPRPALYTEMDGWLPEIRTAKLRVRPGLTGIWQVSGRSNLSFEDYVRLDLFYVHNWNLWRDLSIVGRTFPVVLNRDGAY